jgi:hypothetical protein
MHVLNSAEAALERGGHDDDGHLGTALAQLGSDFGAEFAVAEVVVEDCNIDMIEQLIGFLDGGGGD